MPRKLTWCFIPSVRKDKYGGQTNRTGQDNQEQRKKRGKRIFEVKAKCKLKRRRLMDIPLKKQLNPFQVLCNPISVILYTWWFSFVF